MKYLGKNPEVKVTHLGEDGKLLSKLGTEDEWKLIEQIKE